ncbi:MAG: hypothetical protein ACXW4M_00285 [Anaerolineales bacterium]
MRRSSTESTWRIDTRLVLAVAALAAVLFYLLVSALIFRIGFPLDDSWIHLTYARNFAGHGEWAYRLGERSAGSTSPLWTVLLAIGFLVRLAPYLWTYFLGWVVLTVLAIHAENVARKLVGSYKPRLPWVGLFFVFAWHLTWSAVSGMETLLHGFIVFVVLAALMSGTRRYLTLGLLAGLSIWVRPDGLTLLGPILLTAFLCEDNWSMRGEAVFKTLIGFGALFLPYLLFNLVLSGNPMPNTFYAKQAEYEAYWLSKSFTQRVSDYLWPIIASPFLVLIPGVFIWANRSFRTRNWGALAGVIWFFGYLMIYFMRLPAYQHGRYMIPAFPIMYLWGLLGLLEFAKSTSVNRRFVLLWQMIIGVLCIAFGFIGARQNAYDVYWIESEMVETAKWVKQNLPPESVLAVHDIGALGYYVQNPLIDLAGLITPEVVPFIRDETRLVEYLDSSAAEYLIVFPGLYPHITSQRTPTFVAGLEFDPLQIEEDMQVYRWK